MALKEVIALIDAEIATLKEARALLAAGSAVTVAKAEGRQTAKGAAWQYGDRKTQEETQSVAGGPRTHCGSRQKTLGLSKEGRQVAS